MFDGQKMRTFPDIEGLTENDIYFIEKDKGGNIWIGAIGIGAYRYDGKNFMLYNKTDEPQLIERWGIQGFTEDRNGTMWFGFSGGLFRFDGEQFVNVTQNGPW